MLRFPPHRMVLIENLIRRISDINPLQVAFLETSLRGLLPQEFVASAGLTVKDPLAEQFHFRKHKRGRFSNESYMGKRGHGLALPCPGTTLEEANRRQLPIDAGHVLSTP